MGKLGDRGSEGRIALQVAMPEEAMALLSAGDWRRLSSSSAYTAYEGHIGGVTVVLSISGVGRARAEAATRSFIEEVRPVSMLSLGFAGGLVSGQRVGDLVVAETLLPLRGPRNGGGDASSMEPIASHSALSESARRVLTQNALRHQAGASVTASHVVSEPEEKRRLGESTGALAVEMESYWTAAVCGEFQVPFLAARSIVDELDSPLPGYIVKSALESGSQGMWRHVLPTLLRPHHAPGLINLAFAASAARRSLARFVRAFVAAPAEASLI